MRATSVASRRRFVPSSFSVLGPRRGAPLLYNRINASRVSSVRARNSRAHTVSHPTQASTLAGPVGGPQNTPPTVGSGTTRTQTRSVSTQLYGHGPAARVAITNGVAEFVDQDGLLHEGRSAPTPSPHSFGGLLDIDAIPRDQPQMTPPHDVNLVPHKRSQETFAVLDTFPERHLGPRANEVAAMCNAIGVDSVRELVEQTIPSSIRTETPLDLPLSNGEVADLEELRTMMDQNQSQFRSHLGSGYYPSVTPQVVLRNMLENPSWYTPYTPYQAEISQGRLEMLLNFQTVITDITALPVANCGLLDEATSAAEAMSMCANVLSRYNKRIFLVSDACHAQTIAVLQTRAEASGVEVHVVPTEDIAASVTTDVCGVLVQYPDADGILNDASSIVDAIQSVEAQASKRPLLVAATDLLALTLFRPPGEWGADICVGSAQRFGIPLGFGGPHAGFMSCRSDLARKMPGRIIGVSKDKHGDRALRMALQTREQHIKRDRATSNVCTAQALLANMSAAFAVYHGPEGLLKIARHVHNAARTLAVGLELMGFPPSSDNYFDTVHIDLTAHPGGVDRVVQAAYARQINIKAIDDKSISISFDETTQESHIDDLFHVFADAFPQQDVSYDARTIAASLPPLTGTLTSSDAEVENSNDAHANLHRDLLSPPDVGNSFANHHNMTFFTRTSKFLEHPVFNSHHSETEMLRYLYSLERKDLGLNTAMVPLGSCTMKLNAVSEMAPVTWPSVGNMHPFAPEWQTKGYQALVADMEHMLARVTGFHSVSLQPNSGAQGEFTGLMAIRAFHRANGDNARTMCLIPTSAHGTNPASAVMAGFSVVPVKCDDAGNMDIADLKVKLAANEGRVGAFMITYPSTHGVFEESIGEVCELIHEAGGQVYMDGANLNAQLGYCSPGEIGADVCHLNLHKTFCIPHGGGGPGMGPIGVAEHLARFLPSHPVVPTGGEQSLGTVAGAPYSSASILPITWMYIRMMSGDGLKAATEIAILNANYLRARLSDAYDVVFTGKNGFCAHEFILDIRPFAKHGITESDVAKRLQDFSFHAPTMSWPVKGTLMIEPTESEGLPELNRFVDAMLTIREEIQEIIDGKADRDDNVLKNAPHTIASTMVDEWTRPYPREKAVYPQSYLRYNKFWPSVGRVNESYGDKHFVCTCPAMEEYE